MKLKLTLLFLLAACGASYAQFAGQIVGPPAVPPYFFGMDWQNSGTFPSVNSSAYRLHDTSTRWADIASCDGGTDPTNPCYDWTKLDALLTKYNGADAEYTFTAVPSYAGPAGTQPPSDVNCDGTGTDNFFKHFVTALTAHVGTKIKYWEMWNEIDNSIYWDNPTIIAGCSGNANAAAIMHVRMTQDAAAIIKAANPNAVVMSPSIANSPGANGVNNGWNRWFANGGGAYIDRVSIHIGGANSGSNCAVGSTTFPTTERLITALGTVSTALNGYGMGSKPWEVTEGQWSANAACLDVDFQAMFMSQTYPILYSLNYQRYYFYAWNVANVFLTTVRNGSVLSKSGITYGVMQYWLNGNNPVGACSLTGSIRKCDYTRTSPVGYSSEVIWDTATLCGYSEPCTSTPTVVASKYTQYVDNQGNVFPIGSNHTVPVSPNAILLEAIPSGSPAPPPFGAVQVAGAKVSGSGASLLAGAGVPANPPPDCDLGDKIVSDYFGIGNNKKATGVGVIPAKRQRLFNIFPNSDFPAWANIETWGTYPTGSPTYNSSYISPWMTYSSNNNVELMWVMTRTPGFIQSNPAQTCPDAAGLCSPPSDLASGATCADGTTSNCVWKDFIHWAVDNYACTGLNRTGCVKWFEIWNEPDGYWKGTKAQLAQMHKDAATIIHAKNSHLCVASGAPQGKSTSISTGSAAFLNGFLSLLAGQDVNGHDYVDIVGYHMYLNSCATGQNCSPSDQTAGTLVDEKYVRQVMTSAGLGSKPLQNTEWAPVSGIPDNLGGNQAQFLATAYIIQLSNGDRGIYWYDPDVSPISGIYSLYTDTSFTAANSAGQAWNWVRSNTLGKTPTGPCVATYTTGAKFTCDYNDASLALYRFAWDAKGTAGATTTASGFTHYQTFDGVTHSVSGSTVPIGRDPVLLMP